MQMVILAGGLGTRLGELTASIPKPMVLIHGRPFLQYQIELLKKNGINSILLCIGHLGEAIQAYFGDGSRLGVRISYSHEGEKLLGTGGCLKNAEPHLESAFFVMYGDSYLMLDYAAVEKAFQSDPEKGLMVVYKNNNQYDQSNITVAQGYILDYGIDKAAPKAYIDEGLSVLRKDFLADFKSGEVFSLGSLFQKLIRQRKLRALETSQRFYEIGSPAGFEEFKALLTHPRGDQGR